MVRLVTGPGGNACAPHELTTNAFDMPWSAPTPAREQQKQDGEQKPHFLGSRRGVGGFGASGGVLPQEPSPSWLPLAFPSVPSIVVVDTQR